MTIDYGRTNARDDAIMPQKQACRLGGNNDRQAEVLKVNAKALLQLLRLKDLVKDVLD